MTLDVRSELEKTVVTLEEVYPSLSVVTVQYVYDFGVDVRHGFPCVRAASIMNE
jgi:hypothetical protein